MEGADTNGGEPDWRAGGGAAGRRVGGMAGRRVGVVPAPHASASIGPRIRGGRIRCDRRDGPPLFGSLPPLVRHPLVDERSTCGWPQRPGTHLPPHPTHVTPASRGPAADVPL